MSRLISHLFVLGLTLALTHGLQSCKTGDQLCSGDNAGCQGDKCVCNAGFVGDEYIGCFPEGTKFCSLVNDPKGKNFAGDPDMKGSDIPLPCLYMAADFVTEPKDLAASQVKKCTVEVKVAEERYMGKFYVSGFQVYLNYRNRLGFGAPRKGVFGFRAHATLEGTNMQIDYATRTTVNGDWTSGRDISALELLGNNQFYYDTVEKRIVLSLPGCGVRMYFRPADFEKKLAQTYRPGFILAVDENSQNVQYRDDGEPYCLSGNPTGAEDKNLADLTEAYELGNDETLTLRAIKKRMSQDFPGVTEGSCKQTSRVIRNTCTSPELWKPAMEACFFILSEPNFVTCYNGKENKTGSDKTLELLKLCMKAYCSKSSRVCRNFQRSISDAQCSHLARPETVGYDCDFTPAPTEAGTV